MCSLIYLCPVVEVREKHNVPCYWHLTFCHKSSLYQLLEGAEY